MLNKLGNAKPTVDDEKIEDLYRQFVNVVYVARILLGSDFLTAAVVDEQWRKTLGATDLSFLLRLRRRLERVALYYEGAECFMGAGMGLFTKMMGSKSGNAQPRLTLEWVHDKWPWAEIPQVLNDHNAHHLHPELVLIQHLDACGLHAFHQMRWK
ncbi:hypothetical protein A0H81_10388 [Grifola frondosa]|uniref:Uncharacterized protein n=1 Tax=Grifola frondosa TaxID=5627 RepID=A0A1C7LYI5_GRIFR|nr:hypothetical protein A0H81_10388 [Grifola frondosa]